MFNVEELKKPVARTSIVIGGSEHLTFISVNSFLLMFRWELVRQRPVNSMRITLTDIYPPSPSFLAGLRRDKRQRRGKRKTSPDEWDKIVPYDRNQQG